MAFLLTADNLYWAKAPAIAAALPVDLSLSAFADYSADRATFTANVGGAYLPGLPVPVGADLRAACTLGNNAVTTGRIARVAETRSAAFFVLLFPREAISVGRKRIWHVRHELASVLPADLRELFTRRRTGTIPAFAP
jgi:hypothetical protein